MKLKSGRVKFSSTAEDTSEGNPIQTSLDDSRSGDHLHNTTANRLGDLRGETNFEGTRKRIELKTAGKEKESPAMYVANALGD